MLRMKSEKKKNENEKRKKSYKLLSQSAVHWNKAENNDKSALKPKRHKTNMLPNGSQCTGW